MLTPLEKQLLEACKAERTYRRARLKGFCVRCGKSVAFPGAAFCGVACWAVYQEKPHVDPIAFIDAAIAAAEAKEKSDE